MPLNAALSVPLTTLTLAFAILVATTSRAQDTSEIVGDPDRGKIVFRSVGYCVNCHGWAGDGKAGISPQSPVGADLRETALDTAALTEVIGCGRPETAMPYHDRAAYRDGRCNGKAFSEFGAGMAPVRGKTFSDRDVANVVAFLQTHVIGQGEPTREDCTWFYDNPTAAACSGMD